MGQWGPCRKLFRCSMGNGGSVSAIDIYHEGVVHNNQKHTLRFFNPFSFSSFFFFFFFPVVLYITTFHKCAFCIPRRFLLIHNIFIFFFITRWPFFDYFAHFYPSRCWVFVRLLERSGPWCGEGEEQKNEELAIAPREHSAPHPLRMEARTRSRYGASERAQDIIVLSLCISDMLPVRVCLSVELGSVGSFCLLFHMTRLKDFAALVR